MSTRASYRHRHGRGGQLRAFFAFVLALLCGLGVAIQARAQDKITCKVSTDRSVDCTVDLEARFDAEVRTKLKSGFQNTLLYRIYVRRVEDDAPVSLTARRNLQLYELWDDVFYVYIGGSKQNARKVSDLDKLVDELARFEVQAAVSLPPGTYYVDVIVEINPLSADEEAEIRSWIARSRGGHRTFATGDRSFFGTFVSLFVNIRPGSAERTFRFQSKTFSVPP